MREDDTVTIKLDELVGLFERIDQLETEVRDLKQRVDDHEEDLSHISATVGEHDRMLNDRMVNVVHIGGGRL